MITKLYRFGLIHRTREYPKNGPWNRKSKRRSYEHESLQFSTFLRKIAEEWEALATSGRIRRKKQNQKEQEEIQEIKKQERLEWERYQRELGL